MVSRSPSLSAASEQLHISVQTLSSSITSLENELNLTLLERSSKGVIMTKEGLFRGYAGNTAFLRRYVQDTF